MIIFICLIDSAIRCVIDFAIRADAQGDRKIGAYIDSALDRLRAYIV